MKKKLVLKKRQQNQISVTSFNMDYHSQDKFDQIDELNEINSDILFLQESSINISEKFEEYISPGNIRSHMGFANILINKKLTPTFSKVTKYRGIILCEVNTIFGIIICGSIHLEPSKSNIEKRRVQIKFINNFITSNNYEKYPIIIGGDTNMRDYEGNPFILNDAYDDDDKYSYATWPNRSFEKYKNYNYDFRFDRFLYKNLICSNFNIINTENSDHYMISIKIELND